MTTSQRGEGFPDRDAHGEIEDIPQDWITLWTRWIRHSGFPPPPVSVDQDAKRDYAEHRNVHHGNRDREGGWGGEGLRRAL